MVDAEGIDLSHELTELRLAYSANELGNKLTHDFAEQHRIPVRDTSDLLGNYSGNW